MESTTAQPGADQSIAAGEARRGDRWKAGDWLVRCVLPLYLGGGALMKYFTGTPADLPGPVKVHAPGLLGVSADAVFFMVISTELCLALLLALHRGLARPLAALTLLIFAGVLVQQWASGADACGCFGSVKVPTWVMLVVDVALLAMVVLLPFRRFDRAAVATSRNSFDIPAARWVGLGAGCLACVTAVFMTGPRMLSARVVTGPACTPVEDLAGRPVLIDPREWIGLMLRDTPLACYLEDGWASRATTDVQLWVLYDHACPHCHALFANRFAGVRSLQEGQVIAVDMNTAVVPDDLRPQCPSCVRVDPKPGVRLVTPGTPMILTVRLGRVVAVELP